MMRTTSKEVLNSLVFTGVDYLINKHDQIRLVHIKIAILLQSRRKSLWRIQCVAWRLAFQHTQAAIVNNTKRSSPGEGKLPLKLAVIDIKPKPFFRTGRSGNHAGERMLTFFEDIETVWNGVSPRIAVFRHHMPLHIIFSTKRFFVNGTEPTHVNSSGAECRLRKR